MPSLQGDVNVPLLGGIPKKGLLIGGIAGLGVVGYILYRRHQTATALGTAATGYGYGASAYGYGTNNPGYYGYGSDFQSYPEGEAYGYGAYGYGMYNPYTGQYYGSGPGGPLDSGQPPSWWTTPPSWFQSKPRSPKPGTSSITSQGNMDLNRIARLEGISLAKLLRLNPHLKRYEGTGKHIPRGTKIKV